MNWPEYAVTADCIMVRELLCDFFLGIMLFWRFGCISKLCKSHDCFRLLGSVFKLEVPMRDARLLFNILLFFFSELACWNCLDMSMLRRFYLLVISGKISAVSGS